MRKRTTMTCVISAVIDEGGQVSGVRHDAQSALELALDYRRNGFTNVRVIVGDDSYSLEEFRMYVG